MDRLQCFLTEISLWNPWQTLREEKAIGRPTPMLAPALKHDYPLEWSGKLQQLQLDLQHQPDLSGLGHLPKLVRVPIKRYLLPNHLCLQSQHQVHQSKWDLGHLWEVVLLITLTMTKRPKAMMKKCYVGFGVQIGRWMSKALVGNWARLKNIHSNLHQLRCIARHEWESNQEGLLIFGKNISPKKLFIWVSELELTPKPCLRRNGDLLTHCEQEWSRFQLQCVMSLSRLTPIRILSS